MTMEDRKGNKPIGDKRMFGFGKKSEETSQGTIFQENPDLMKVVPSGCNTQKKLLRELVIAVGLLSSCQWTPLQTMYVKGFVQGMWICKAIAENSVGTGPKI